MKFALGKLVITTACKAHMESIAEQPLKYLMRHLNCDWGELEPEDKQANEQAINCPIRILSRYTLRDWSSIYIITEHDRSYTTIMLSDEY
ncbi:hypothetical protein [Herbaspirillum aquaticum]|uniref:Type I restriction endonuclease subunit M n=1 Tax=Herbaspirillum aquaticum TaxID=568783 RepID=A0A225SVD6_9BURK|nr:hypothetical protein [Herbaspirillum aquaticum]OWY33468.1 hypothetical protein CEJ45_17280 [Herbaspirillum aquaticum]